VGCNALSICALLCLCAKIAIAATQSIFRTGGENKNTERTWIHPVFDAEKGKLKTHKGRLEKTDGDDNDKDLSNQSPRIF